MELTPKLLIEDVDFPVVRRGYDPDQVDTFLERVAAGLAQIQRQLAEARERAALAEKRLAAAEERPEPAADQLGTDEIQRTLVLAQRTADAAVAEAKEEAARLVEEARAESRRLVDEATREAARRDDEARSRLREEIDRLDAERDGLRAESAALHEHVTEQRDRLRTTLAELQRLVDDPSVLAVSPGPAPTVPDEGDDQIDVRSLASVERFTTVGPSADTGPFAERPDDGGSGSGPDIDLNASTPSSVMEADPSPPENRPAAGPGGEQDHLDAGDDSARSTDLEAPAVRRAFSGGSDPSGQPTKLQQAAQRSGGTVDLREEPRPARPAEGRHGMGGARPRGTGLRPPTSSLPGLGITDEDAFLNDLREAMADDSPLGPRDEDEPRAAHDERRRGRFRRR